MNYLIINKTKMLTDEQSVSVAGEILNRKAKNKRSIKPYGLALRHCMNYVRCEVWDKKKENNQ